MLINFNKSRWNPLLIKLIRRFHWEFLVINYFIFFTGCTEEKLPEDYLAVVNDRMLTMSTVKYLIDSTYLNDVSLERVIDSWIEMELLTQAALSEGFEAKEEYAVLNDFNSRKLLAAQYLQEKLKEVNLNVSKEELENYFNKHINEFVLDYDIYKVNQIITKNLDKAIELRNTTLSQLDFSKSVRVIFKPEDLIDERYGVYLKEFDEMPYELANMIQTLDEGEITYPIFLGNGEYLVTQLVLKYEKNSEPKIEFVKEMIEERIIFERQREFYQKFISELIKKADIKIRDLK